jgi:hypothetical protein
MAYSSIIIIFNSVPNVNEVLNISETHFGLNLNEIFKTSRLSSSQVKLPVFVAGHEEIIIPPGGHGDPNDPGKIIPATEDHYNGYTSTYYKTAFDLDYNTAGLFVVTAVSDNDEQGGGTVTITAKYPGAIFVLGGSTSDAVITITNESAAPPFNITNVNFSQAPEACAKARINVTTNVLATKIISPISLSGNTSNPLFFDYLRGQSFNLVLENGSGVQTSQLVTMPRILNASNFTVNVSNSPNGATVTVTNVNSDGLVLQYSLNNTTWKSSNVFSGLDVGDFTLYVKDQLGCSFNIPFKVDEFGIHSPYFRISKSNSFRLANRITFGDSENYKTDENTLSCEADVILPYKETQQFQSADVITTQFESNYAINTFKVVKSDLSEINVPVLKMTNNLGIKDKRDAIKYNLGNGKTGVYFIAGNLYNYDTNATSGTYALNGSLPEWAQIGNYIVISNAWFLIEEIVYDEIKNVEIIQFSNNYTGPDVNIVAGSVFNRFNYEVYEATIDMVDYIDQTFRVRLNNSDPYFTTLTHLSELIWCKVKHENVLEIKYYNSTNTDMFYATGIINLIRIPFIYMKGKADESSEVHKTDTNSILLNADIYEIDEIVFEPVTKEIWRKLSQALSHENVTINGVGYVKNGNFNTEGPLENTNLYSLTATMIKTGSVYNSQTSGNLDFNGSEVEVPGLIETDIGYVSY